MTENYPNIEQEPIHATFGDVVIAPSHNRGLPSVVVTANRDGHVNAMAILNEAEHQYGMPGTLPPGSIEAVIGHKTYDEVVMMCSYMFTGGEPPSSEIIARVKLSLQKETA